MSYPDNNPKTAIGAKKVPLHLVPPSASHYLALALADGAGKYGPYNWRDAAISVSVYKAAAQRHWDAYWDGEDNAPDSGVHHLAHAMACCALLLDALTVGKLNDDRPTAGAAARLQAEYAPAPKEHRRVATPAELKAYRDNGPRAPGMFAVGDRVRVTEDQVDTDAGQVGTVKTNSAYPWVEFDEPTRYSAGGEWGRRGRMDCIMDRYLERIA